MTDLHFLFSITNFGNYFGIKFNIRIFMLQDFGFLNLRLQFMREKNPPRVGHIILKNNLNLIYFEVSTPKKKENSFRSFDIFAIQARSFPGIWLPFAQFIQFFHKDVN